MSDMVTITGAEATLERFQKISSTDASVDKVIREAVRAGLREAAKKLQGQARTGLGMRSDPRSAYKAVRSMVYKKIRGGNVSILDPKKAGRRVAPPQNKRPKGNGRPRSKRTEDLLTYYGKDRGFILRFLNNGTGDRETKDGYRRGSISARNWFGGASHAELEKMAAGLEKIMEDVISGAFMRLE